MSHLATQAPAPRLRSPARRFVRTLLVLLVAILVVVAGAAFLAWRIAVGALPQLDGAIAVPGLAAPVDVYRDARGTPHLYAASLEDALAAQGYLHAQDRLWQMDLLRRVAAGELSEVFGKGTLAMDRENRILGMRLAAARAAAALPTEGRSVLEAYARGVNAFIETHRESLPIEFRLLRYRPKPWQARDSLLVALYMYKALTNTWPSELQRARVTARVGVELAADLYPSVAPEDRPIAEPLPPPARRTRAGVQPSHAAPDVMLGHWVADEAVGPFSGSNNWVVSGKHTASGAPLLANDMHLPLDMPTIWYMVHIVAPGLNVAGVSLPGVPLVIVGHNEDLAWGFTNLGADVQDLYDETFDASNPSLYLAKGVWRQVERRKEVISVKGSAPAEVEVLLTRHGPIVWMEGNKRYALRWTATDPGGLGAPFLAMAKAHNWDEFCAALRNFPGPAQNVVYADRNGNIGYHAAGLVPIRRRGTGAVPAAGETDDSEWVGYIPFEALPHSFNPPSGILATANGRVVPADYPYFLTDRWMPPYRTARIFQLLEQNRKFAVEDFLRIQGDITSLPNQFLAGQLVAAAAKLGPVEPGMREAISALAHWDGRATTDSAETTICEYTRPELMRLLLEPKLGKGWHQYTWPESTVFLENVLRERPARWLPPRYKVYDALLLDALRAAFARLNDELHTSDWKQWRWGRIMQIEMVHPLGGRIPILRRLFNVGPYPQPGTGACVKQTARHHGPSERMVIDFADLDRSVLNLPAGESGQVASPYYRNQFSAWLKVESFPLPFSEAAVKQAAQHHLQLKPAAGPGSPIP